MLPQTNHEFRTIAILVFFHTNLIVPPLSHLKETVLGAINAYIFRYFLPTLFSRIWGINLVPITKETLQYFAFDRRNK